MSFIKMLKSRLNETVGLKLGVIMRNGHLSQSWIDKLLHLRLVGVPGQGQQQ